MTAPPIIYPTLFYNDGLAAMAWLERAFGFEPLMSVPGENGELVHGEMHFRGAVVFISAARPAQGYFAPRKRGELECALSIGITDAAEVDAIYERAKAAGAEILLEPHSTDYMERGFDCLDPEGHYWGFGTYRPTVEAN